MASSGGTLEPLKQSNDDSKGQSHQSALIVATCQVSGLCRTKPVKTIPRFHPRVKISRQSFQRNTTRTAVHRCCQVFNPKSRKQCSETTPQLIQPVMTRSPPMPMPMTAMTRFRKRKRVAPMDSPWWHPHDQPTCEGIASKCHTCHSDGSKCCHQAASLHLSRQTLHPIDKAHMTHRWGARI